MSSTTTMPVASETVQFPSDGFTIKAFLAHPAQSTTQAPAVMILHEWWGLTDHIKTIARRFVEEGYVALAPDLYSRQGYAVTSDPNEAARLMSTLSSQAALRDLNAATQFLSTQPFVDPLHLGIIGFSMGGTLALTMATHNSDFKVAVVFYGKIPLLESLDALLCPVLYHYAAQDTWVTKQEVDRLRQGLEQYGKPGEIVSYNCPHAFFNETRQEVYRRSEASRAWETTRRFFATHLH